LTSLTADQLKALAYHGAQARINELRQEIVAIEQAFPDLRTRRGGRPRKQIASNSQVESAAGTGAVKRRRRRGWSAAARKAAATRMKAYWAKRKSRRKK
jgi:hypothetical protein